MHRVRGDQRIGGRIRGSFGRLGAYVLGAAPGARRFTGGGVTANRGAINPAVCACAQWHT